ncbi:MAG: hypothetical protein SGARI_001051 [Bacillariaceae sp.]
MKSFLSIAVGSLMASVVAQDAAEPFYCGQSPCIVPMRLSCEEMIEKYHFQGSCCSMESIDATRGCRLTVADRGNCFWYPYCGFPDPFEDEIGDNVIYSTDSDAVCPESQFDPVGESANRTDVSCVPTMAPSPGPGSPTNPPIGASAPSQTLGLLTMAAAATIASFCL